MRSETGFDLNLLNNFPSQAARSEAEREKLCAIWQAPKGFANITAVNNNYIGVYYVGTAFLFFILAGGLALLMRTQLAVPLNGVLSQEFYNQAFTVHGTTMMFLFAVPAVEAMGVLLLPQMIAARDLPFPRLSAYAFWAYFVGGLCFFASIFFGVAPDGGWFMYPPLTSIEYSPGINADFWLLGIGFIEISAIAGAIEIIVGIMKTRAPGMTLDKLPMFAWAMLVFAAMIVIGFPAVIAGTLLLELERAVGWPFFDAAKGGDPILWQHLFWFFGHPEVYIIFLPAAGFMSMIIPSIAGVPLVGYRLVVMAIVATGFISFGVWVHHMFTTGLPTLSISFFSAASSAVSVPAGVQVFAWIATVAAGRMRFSVPGLFALGALVIFTMGGLTGVMVAMVPFDWQAHDSYFIVAHLHYVLIGGMVFPFFAALYYWTPMTSKTALSERLGKWVFWLMFTGVHLTFLPMHFSGLAGMPRRIWTYQPNYGWDFYNLLSTGGSYLIALGVLIFLVDLVRNFRFSATESAGNIYGGGTLEWLPADVYSTRSIPVIRERYALWDDESLSDDVDKGRYILPYSATGLRETLITSPFNAEPQYLQIMPSHSWWHVGGAVFTAGFFLLFTVQLYGASLVSGVLAIACILRWLWDTDRAPLGSADVGGGIKVPIYTTGIVTHSVWAMYVLFAVGSMIFLMLVFSYVFLWSQNPNLWNSVPNIYWAAPICGAYLLAAAAAYYTRNLLKRGTYSSGIPVAIALLLSAALMIAGWGMDITTWRLADLFPQQDSYGASVYAILALQAFLIAVFVVMACYAMARAIAGYVDSQRTGMIDIVVLFLIYIAFQGSAGVLITRLFPLAV